MVLVKQAIFFFNKIHDRHLLIQNETTHIPSDLEQVVDFELVINKSDTFFKNLQLESLVRVCKVLNHLENNSIYWNTRQINLTDLR